MGAGQETDPRGQNVSRNRVCGSYCGDSEAHGPPHGCASLLTFHQAVVSFPTTTKGMTGITRNYKHPKKDQWTSTPHTKPTTSVSFPPVGAPYRKQKAQSGILKPVLCIEFYHPGYTHTNTHTTLIKPSVANLQLPLASSFSLCDSHPRMNECTFNCMAHFIRCLDLQ